MINHEINYRKRCEKKVKTTFYFYIMNKFTHVNDNEHRIKGGSDE